jgi:hypothetical protein
MDSIAAAAATTTTTVVHQHIASDENAVIADTMTFGGCVSPLTLDSASNGDALYQQRIDEIDRQVAAGKQNTAYTPSKAWRGLMRA